MITPGVNPGDRREVARSTRSGAIVKKIQYIPSLYSLHRIPGDALELIPMEDNAYLTDGYEFVRPYQTAGT